ncbi:MAG: helicase-related protein [Gemmatimonadales bacterium]
MAVSDPLRTSLVAGPAAGAPEVARALARSLAPAERAACPPSWLLPCQVRSFRRVLAALQRCGGAMLADPVGSGKTYVALAVAAALQPRRPTACLVPAALAEQWRVVAGRLDVEVEVCTHQQASRGRLPGSTRGLVLIDESHHYRNPRIRRYLHTAQWLLGRPVLLLSATPVVNRMEDLAHQLLLGVRDDALLADGIVSIRVALASGACASALGRVVVEDTAAAGPRPARRNVVSTAGEDECAAAAHALDRLASLRLSIHLPTAALVRGVLQRAMASSPPALVGALRRYRNLLLHARDACRAGRVLGRAELREFAGDLDDQLVLWELCADEGGAGELALEELGTIDMVLAAAAQAAAEADPKVERLRRVLADDLPSLVFTTHRETVRHLRERLGPPAVAWCTGERAGLGHAPAPRSAVLGWFRDGGSWPAPRVLVVTDVAAEGLDLKRAARVVHYDLPWTPMRLEQREGRAVRLGSTHELVEVVRFVPPPSVESALGLERHLARKTSLPGRAGLGADGVRLWRWRSALADRLGDGPSTEGTAVVRLAMGRGASPGGPGLLAGFDLLAVHRVGPWPLAAVVGWLDPGGRWTEDEAVVTARLLAAARSEDCVPAPPGLVRVALDRLLEPIRARLALTASRRWAAAEPEPAARRLAARLGACVREAARRRDAGSLTRLERALAFAAGGHTAGEAQLVRRLADAEGAELAGALARIPAPTPRWEGIEVRVTGLVLFER